MSRICSYKMGNRKRRWAYPPIQMRQYSKVYNNQISMSGVSKAEEMNNSEFQKSKVITNSDEAYDGEIYNIQLAVSQANAIMKLLPKRYIIHVDRSLKTKRAPKRITFDKKNNKSKKEEEQQMDINEMVEEPIQQQNIQTIDYEQMIRKCQKMVNLLKKNKNSWPFREPVDPIAMGIPHYCDIVTNPMDLKTIQQNLALQKYQTISQFYADVQLIINNSYLFNKNNVQYYSITSQFQKYFQKIKSEPLMTNSVSLPATIKKMSSQASGTTAIARQKSESRSTIQIHQRKQIALKLKQLPKQELLQIISKINEGEKNHELNLQTLPVEKIKYLQEYFVKKESSSNQSKAKEQTRKQVDDDQSSFQSDSDS